MPPARSAWSPACAIAAICVSALAYAALPIFPMVLAAASCTRSASCVLGPAMAAISLGLVGHAAIGERLGRNARFASIGNGLAAAAMGACGYFLSARAVFFVTAAAARARRCWRLRMISPSEIDPERAHGAPPRRARQAGRPNPGELMRQSAAAHFRRLSVMLFHLANAAMLPLMGSVVTMRSSHWATVLIAACIVVPQLLVAVFSPWVGRAAQSWGRRPLLLIGFAALPLRGILFADGDRSRPCWWPCSCSTASPPRCSACMVPLVVADLTRGTGHFNLGQGIVGTTIGIGASLSTTFAGYMSDHFGSPAAFAGLAAIAVIGLTVCGS